MVYESRFPARLLRGANAGPAHEASVVVIPIRHSLNLTRVQIKGCVPAESFLVVPGFSSDQGATWLVSITCSGVAWSIGATYEYSNGEATWFWSGITFGLQGENGSNVSCTTVNN